MSNPTVCICVPCYNNEETIYETLKSLVDQDYDNLIIKVFDNASTDKTRDIVRSFMDKNRDIGLNTREKTVSGEDNFNTCIENAEGDFTAIFHADDIYTENMVSEQVNFLLDHEKCGAVATHAIVIDENSNVKGQRFVPYEIVKQKSVELDRDALLELSFQYGNFVTCPSVLFRTQVLKTDIKNFRGNLFKSSSDLDVWIRVARNHSFGFINKPLIHYRESNASFSFNLARVRITDHDLFLVLNYVLEKNGFSEIQRLKLTEYRNFLLMKDRSNTNLNRLMLKKGNFQYIDTLSNVRYAFNSMFHFKYFVIAFLVKIVVMLPFSSGLSALLQRVKFANDK